MPINTTLASNYRTQREPLIIIVSACQYPVNTKFMTILNVVSMWLCHSCLDWLSHPGPGLLVDAACPSA